MDAKEVREIELGTTIGEIAGRADASEEAPRAVILGGYFGTWATARAVWDLPLDPAIMKTAGLTFGCGNRRAAADLGLRRVGDGRDHHVPRP